MEPSDIVERLREVYAGDHERGCDARYHVCKCGFDRRAETAAQDAAAEIERLRDILREAHDMIAHGPASGLAWKYTLDKIDDALNRPRSTECAKLLASKIGRQND